MSVYQLGDEAGKSMKTGVAKYTAPYSTLDTNTANRDNEYVAEASRSHFLLDPHSCREATDRGCRNEANHGVATSADTAPRTMSTFAQNYLLQQYEDELSAARETISALRKKNQVLVQNLKTSHDDEISRMKNSFIEMETERTTHLQRIQVWRCVWGGANGIISRCAMNTGFGRHCSTATATDGRTGVTFRTL